MKSLNIIAVGLCSLALASCAGELEVKNPNKITDEQMMEFMQSDEKTQEQVLTGLVGGLNGYMRVYDASLNGGYSNSGGYEFYKDFRMVMESGDIVEGTKANPGAFSTWYQNKADNLYWTTIQDVNNYGYYLAAVYKISSAQKALDFLTKEACEAGTLQMKNARAQALTSKAYGYARLMERYTDLKDPASTTAQGMPLYDKYAYNTPVAPSSVADTWKYIADMLDEAISLFHQVGNQGYTTGTSEAADTYDIDCGVAQYIRAMVALDRKDYETVIDAYNDINSKYPNLIKAEDYGMLASKVADVTATVDRGNGKRSFSGGSFNAENNAFYNISKNPEALFTTIGGSNQCWPLRGLNNLKNAESGFCQVDKDIVDALSDSDVRKAIITKQEYSDYWIYETSSGDTTWYNYTMPAYTSMKFAATEGRDLGDTYAPHTNNVTKSDEAVFRTSAVLLMAAEAYTMNNQESQAEALLNKLLAARTLPGESAMTVASCKKGSMLDFVKLQWRIEMWGEGDFAFFNQKRWGSQFSRGANHWSTKGVEAQGWTWEIPQRERQGNTYWN